MSFGCKVTISFPNRQMFWGIIKEITIIIICIFLSRARTRTQVKMLKNCCHCHNLFKPLIYNNLIRTRK